MGTAPAFASVGEAMEAARAALGYLAAADAAAAGRGEPGRVPAGAGADRGGPDGGPGLGPGRVHRRARATPADADYSARVWLMHQTGITRGAAVSHTAWAKRDGTHPKVVAALAAGELSESYGRAICLWTDKLPEKYRDASPMSCWWRPRPGLGLADLSALFAEMYERARGDLPDRGSGPGVRRPGGAAGDDVRRRRGHARGPDPRVRRGGGQGAGRAVRPGRERR